MRDRLPHICFKIRRKLLIFSTFSTKKFKINFYSSHSLPSLITSVLRVLGVSNVLCVLTPLMRDRLPHFWFLQFDENCSFFQLFQNLFFLNFLLIPLTAQPYNCCSKGSRGLKFVMRIDSPHAGPITTFLFLNSMNIVQFFNFFKTNIKKYIINPTHCPAL